MLNLSKMFILFNWILSECSACSEMGSANTKGKCCWMHMRVCACEQLFQQNFTRPPLTTFQNSYCRPLKKVTCSCFSYKNKFIQYRTQAENNKKKICFQSNCVIHTACLSSSRSLGQECVSSETKCHFSVNWSDYFHWLHSFMLISSYTLSILWKILHIPPKYLSLLLCKYVSLKHHLDMLMFKFKYTHISMCICINIVA